MTSLSREPQNAAAGGRRSVIQISRHASPRSTPLFVLFFLSDFILLSLEVEKEKTRKKKLLIQKEKIL